MTQPAQRKYHSPRREQQAEQTRAKILDEARQLIQSKGFDEATIEAIAERAGVAAATVYAVFGSKRCILEGLMERAAFSPAYENLVREARMSDDPEKRLRLAAKIARQIYDALRNETEVLRGVSAVAPDFVRRKERIRFERQAPLVDLLVRKKALSAGLAAEEARDILWTLTGREPYRMLVVERKWSGDRYEEWLGDTLVAALLKK
jgi:AcrR family transcriptional regulator